MNFVGMVGQYIAGNFREELISADVSWLQPRKSNVFKTLKIEIGVRFLYPAWPAYCAPAV
jgi:hypothetical protein